MKGKKIWRLSRTLKRSVVVRPIEDDDVKYAGAAYKKGVNPMGLPEGLVGQDFRSAFEKWVLENAHAAWTISAHTRNGFIPIGFVLGQWGPAFMIIKGIAWFPWASCRNIVEGTVAFFDLLKKQMAWLGFANDEHKRLYEVCCAHGIMQRVGTSHSLGERMAVYEGRA